MSDLRDIIVLLVCCICDGLYFNYGFLFTYHISYVKSFHIDYSISLIYTVIIPVNLGLMFTAYYFQPLVKRLQVKTCLRLYAVSIFVNMILFCVFTNIVWLYISYFLLGALHQLLVMVLIYVLNVKYKHKLVKYTGYVFTGSSVTLIWGYIFSVIMNPNNVEKKMTYILPNGNLEIFFDWSISKNFTSMCMLYGLTNLIVVNAASFLIDIPQHLIDEYESKDDPSQPEKLKGDSSKGTASDAE